MEAGTELTVIERAQVALKSPEYEKQLRALVEGSQAIVAITNAASYQECHSARMGLKRIRINIEKDAKSATEDATAFHKATIAERKRLIEISQPEEDRLEAIQTEHDTKAERERQAKAEAEAARLSVIQEKLGKLTTHAGLFVGHPSAAISRALEEIRAHDVTTWAQEFRPQAEAAKAQAVAALELMLAGTLAQEAAAKAAAEKLESDRAELARLRAEQEERDRAAAESARLQAEEDAKRQAELAASEAASRAKIEAERAAARAVVEAEHKAAQELIERNRAAAAAAQKEAEEKAMAERNARDAQERAERAKRDAEAEKVRQQQAEAQRVIDAENERIAAAQREIALQQQELLATDKLIRVLRARLGTLPRYGQLAAAIDAYLATQVPVSKSQAKRKVAA